MRVFWWANMIAGMWNHPSTPPPHSVGRKAINFSKNRNWFCADLQVFMNQELCIFTLKLLINRYTFLSCAFLEIYFPKMCKVSHFVTSKSASKCFWWHFFPWLKKKSFKWKLQNLRVFWWCFWLVNDYINFNYVNGK